MEISIFDFVSQMWMFNIDIYFDVQDDVDDALIDVHVNIYDALFDVYVDVHVVHFDAHHDGYDGWVGSDNFRSLLLWKV